MKSSGAAGARAVNSVKTAVLCVSRQRCRRAHACPPPPPPSAWERPPPPGTPSALSLLPATATLCVRSLCSCASLEPPSHPSLSRAAGPGGPPRPGGHVRRQSKCTGKRSKGNRGESCHFKIKRYNLGKKKKINPQQFKTASLKPF